VLSLRRGITRSNTKKGREVILFLLKRMRNKVRKEEGLDACRGREREKEGGTQDTMIAPNIKERRYKQGAPRHERGRKKRPRSLHRGRRRKTGGCYKRTLVDDKSDKRNLTTVATFEGEETASNQNENFLLLRTSRQNTSGKIQSGEDYPSKSKKG